MFTDYTKESKLLRAALKGNGTFSCVCGIAFIAAAKPIAEFIGIDYPWIIAAVGASLLTFSCALFINAFRADVNILEARIAITLDFLWVVGSGILIALGILNTGGNWGTAVVADVVLFFAIVQYVGLRRLSPNPAF